MEANIASTGPPAAIVNPRRVGRVTPCAPRLQPASTGFSRMPLANPVVPITFPRFIVVPSRLVAPNPTKSTNFAPAHFDHHPGCPDACPPPRRARRQEPGGRASPGTSRPLSIIRAARTFHTSRAFAYAPASWTAPALRRCGPGILLSQGDQLQVPRVSRTRKTRHHHPAISHLPPLQRPTPTESDDKKMSAIFSNPPPPCPNQQLAINNWQFFTPNHT